MDVVAWGLLGLVCGATAIVTFINANKGGVGHNKVVHGWVITGTADKPLIVWQPEDRKGDEEQLE